MNKNLLTYEERIQLRTLFTLWWSAKESLHSYKNRIQEEDKEFWTCYIENLHEQKIILSHLHSVIQDASKRLKESKQFMMKEHKSRTFPSSLRQAIFERDNFSCRLCGIHKDKAIEKGLHLEVDHIVEWEDGGKTTYLNGQTVCSDCNKGKHHYKKVKRK